MSWVTIYNTFSPGDADLVRSRLESANIEVNVNGLLSALSMDGYSMATGGINIQVPEEMAEEAKALVATKD